MEAVDTKERILKAAETLFAEHGFASASVRAIAAVSETNLNAVNYHFGSKEGLFHAVVHRVMAPVNLDQLKRLDELEATVTGSLSVEQLVQAYITPFVWLLEQDQERTPVISRLVARVLADVIGGGLEAPRLDTTTTEERYLQAFARVLPQLSLEEVWWRLQSMGLVVAFHQVVSGAGGRPDSVQAEGQGRLQGWLLAYVTAAMGAVGGDL